MAGLRELLQKRGERWAWIGQRGHDALGLNGIVPLDMVISCDRGREMAGYFKEECLFPLEGARGPRKDWSNEHLNESLSGPQGRAARERIRHGRGVMNIVCYRALRKLEKPHRSDRYRLLAVPTRLKKKFDNKFFFHDSLGGLGVPVIPGFIASPEKVEYDRAREMLSGEIVLQLAFSSSGLNTFVVSGREQYDVLCRRFAGRPMLFRRRLAGYSANINAVIYHSGKDLKVAVSWPSVQLTGLPDCSNFASSYCGNDYTAAAGMERALVEDLARTTRTVGQWMASYGYRGLFGMDYLINEGRGYPIEINPRLQNSTSLQTELELAEDMDPLLAVHIVEMLSKWEPDLSEKLRAVGEDDLLRPLKGSQVILHNPLQRSIVRGEVCAGVYELSEGTVRYRRPAGRVVERLGKDGMLLTCGVPAEGYEVEPNAPLCKLLSRREALNSEKLGLNARTTAVIKSVYDKLDLEIVPGSVLELRAHSIPGLISEGKAYDRTFSGILHDRL